MSDTAFDVIIVNFANADMVGHSGKLEPTIRAVETVDRELGRIYQAVKQRGGSLLVTADHGNEEMLIDPVTGGPHTALDPIAKDVFMDGGDEKSLLVFRRNARGEVVELIERRKFNDLHLQREPNAK